LETDIEKAREEGNWKKVIELATQLKDKGERGGHFLPSFVAVLGIRIHFGFHWVSGSGGEEGKTGPNKEI
jgi:hypothetical protein